MKKLWYHGCILSIACFTSNGAEIRLSDLTLGTLFFSKYLRTKLPPRLVPMTCNCDFGKWTWTLLMAD